MSIKANFPSIRPSLLLDFANVKALDPRITFTRASTGTYFDAKGVLQTAVSGQARFDHNPTTLESLGLLIEEQRTNLQVYSDDFADAAWTKTNSSITSNTIVAPNGTLTGDKLVEDATASVGHYVGDGFSVTSGTSYAASVYAKAGERTAFQIILLSSGFGVNVIGAFNLSNGVSTVVGGTASSSLITPVGNGWYRCTVIAQATATTSTSQQIRAASTYSASSPASYTGDGTSGIFIWGAQIEAGAFPTSYIPTVAATATRNADVASMTGTNFSSWYRADEGTFYVDWTAGQDDVFINAWSVGSTVVNGGFMNVRRGGSGNMTFNVIDGTTTQAGTVAISGSPIAGTTYKVSSAFKANDFASSTNGAAVVTDTSGTVPSTIGTLLIGNGWNNGGATAANEYLNGTIRKIAFYPTRLSNAQLQALTR
jgi:hypothetical protein